MKRIGLTGGIASGKSLITEYFESDDVVVLDADKIYKNLLKTDKLLYNEIRKAFDLKDIDLKQISNIVFNDEKELKKLNKITHPYVIRAISQQLKMLEKTEKIVVLDVPLLFEAKMENFCDKIICIYTDESTQVERLSKRDNLTADEALKRIKAQMPLSEKCKLSDYVIDNSDGTDYTYQQFKEIYQKLKESIDVS